MKIDLSNSSLTSIPTDLPNATIQLLLCNNDLRSLCGIPPNITYLDITGNKNITVSHLPPNLSTLVLSHTGVSVGTISFPQSLTRLVHVDATQANIKGVEQISSLKFLDISCHDPFRRRSWNTIGPVCLPDSIRILTLSVDVIYSSQLPALLESLEIYNSCVSFVGKFPATLQHVDISDSTMNMSFETLPPNLESLFIWNTTLRYPCCVSTLPQSVTELNFSRLKGCALTFKGCPRRLTNLAISDCIDTISSFKVSRCLRSLFVHDMAFKNFRFARLPETLVELTYTSNRLKKVETHELPRSLRHLDLSNNKLEHVDVSELPRSLRYFDISGNERITKCNIDRLPILLTTGGLRLGAMSVTEETCKLMCKMILLKQDSPMELSYYTERCPHLTELLNLGHLMRMNANLAIEYPLVCVQAAMELLLIQETLPVELTRLLLNFLI